MIFDLPPYKLSQKYEWFGTFEFEFGDQKYNLAGNMKYSFEEPFMLELLATSNKNLVEYSNNNPLSSPTGKEFVIYGVIGEMCSPNVEYATIYCVGVNQYYGSDLSQTKEIANQKIPKSRLNKLYF